MATNTGWWMYHGDPAHTGFVDSGSAINAAALSGKKEKEKVSVKKGVSQWFCYI